MFVTAILTFIAFVGEPAATPGTLSDVDMPGALPVSPAEFLIYLAGAVLLTTSGRALGADDEPRPQPQPPAPSIGTR